jgi:arabinogalactan oligomer/maltooligosaccharide transport system substrate-binding protein
LRGDGAPFVPTLVVLLAIALLGCGAPREPGIVLWHAYTGLEKTALEKTAARWNEHHPATPLTLVAVPYDSFADKLTSAIPRGNGPDLFIYPHDRIGDWADAGTIEPIEFWVDDALASRFTDQASSAMAYRGSMWGLPLTVKSLALFYRTDLVATPPATTDALIALAPAMHAKHGFALAYANVDLYAHAAWLHGFGGRVMDDAGNLTLATPEAADAMAFARNLVAAGVSPADAQTPVVASLFNEGKAATVMSGPWFINDIVPGVPWQVAQLPIISASGRPAAPFVGAEGVLMSAQARDKDLAFAVMDELTSDADAIIRARDARQVVANRRAYEDPEVAKDPALRAFRAQLEHTVLMPNTAAMRMVWTPYKTALTEVLAGRADPGKQLLSLDREVRGYLEHQ